MGEKVFVCANCKNLYEYESAVTNCRICNEVYCEDCIDAEGTCVPCGEIRKGEFLKEKVA